MPAQKTDQFFLTNIATLRFENHSTSSRYFSESKDLSVDGIGHVSRIPQEPLFKQTLYAKVSGKRPVGRPGTRWLDHIKDLGWNRLEFHSSKMQSVLVYRES